MTTLLRSIFALCLGILIGWVSAHNTVAKECDRLGAFYVGDTVYKFRKEEP